MTVRKGKGASVRNTHQNSHTPATATATATDLPHLCSSTQFNLGKRTRCCKYTFRHQTCPHCTSRRPSSSCTHRRRYYRTSSARRSYTSWYRLLSLICKLTCSQFLSTPLFLLVFAGSGNDCSHHRRNILPGPVRHSDNIAQHILFRRSLI